jgi:phosphatidylserine decarboxylase
LLKHLLTPIHRAGWPFIGLLAGMTVVLWLAFMPLGLIGAVLTLWCTYFFRDPNRVTPDREGLIISPADGVVQKVDRAPPPEELGMGGEPRNRVAVFMDIFDVHVNRVPIDGLVAALRYRPGKFVNVLFDKECESNERQSVRLTMTDGRDIAVVQIAGLIARRILCDIVEGQTVKAGERFGMIRFGSRVDVYLPKGVEPLVVSGQRSVAGETVLADVRAQEQGRTGTRR